MFCIKCGQFLPDGSAFCNGCGTAQPAIPAQPMYQQPVQPQYQQPAQPPYQPPVQPIYQQPVQPPYQAPVQPPYQAPVQPPYQQPLQPTYPPTAPKNLSWQGFYQQFVSKKSKSLVIWMAVICFVTAAISLPLMMIAEDELVVTLGIVDIVVYLSMGSLLLATKHWAFALLATIYSGVWTVVGFANDGTPSGIAALAIGIACVGMLVKALKAYQDYKTTGNPPTTPI